jgi:hypothetical protein
MAAERALKADLLDNMEDEDFPFLIPAVYPKRTLRDVSVVSRILGELYKQADYNEDSIIEFCTRLTQIIKLANGPGTDGAGEGGKHHPDIFNGQCAYLGTQPSLTSGCKLAQIHPKLSRFLDLITNTIIAFFSRVASIQPALLRNDVFSQKCLAPFATLIKALYYFASSKIAIPFCYRLLTFKRDINIIFGAPPGADKFDKMTYATKSALPTDTISDYDILIETANRRAYTCGRGIVQIGCKKVAGRQVVAIHKSVSEDDDSEDQMSLLDQLVCGGARRTRRGRKQRKTRRARTLRR